MSEWLQKKSEREYLYKKWQKNFVENYFWIIESLNACNFYWWRGITLSRVSCGKGEKKVRKYDSCWRDVVDPKSMLITLVLIIFIREFWIIHRLSHFWIHYPVQINVNGLILGKMCKSRSWHDLTLNLLRHSQKGQRITTINAQHMLVRKKVIADLDNCVFAEHLSSEIVYIYMYWDRFPGNLD